MTKRVTKLSNGPLRYRLRIEPKLLTLVATVEDAKGSIIQTQDSTLYELADYVNYVADRNRRYSFPFPTNSAAKILLMVLALSMVVLVIITVPELRNTISNAALIISICIWLTFSAVQYLLRGQASVSLQVEMQKQLLDSYEKFINYALVQIASEKMWMSIEGVYGGKSLPIEMRVSPTVSVLNVSMPLLQLRSHNDFSPGLVFLPIGIFFVYERLLHPIPFAQVKCAELEGSLVGYTDSLVPNDATVVSVKWLHERVDGGPDRRFSTNYRTLFVRQSIIRLVLKDMCVDLMFSNAGAAKKLVALLTQYQQYLDRNGLM